MQMARLNLQTFSDTREVPASMLAVRGRKRWGRLKTHCSLGMKECLRGLGPARGGGWEERPVSSTLHPAPQPPGILFPSLVIYDLNIKPGTKFIVLFLGNPYLRSW